MKNIYLIPTDKPSRLFYYNNHLGLARNFVKKNDGVNPQHIYITSDEEIKEGDYVIEDYGGVAYGPIDRESIIENPKKIILTTDQDLIADGVQAIDDEFLEWFVNNPSCEFVDVEHFGTCCGNQSITQCINCKKYNPVYKIIIPKEEPKQQDELAIGFAERCLESLLNGEDPKADTIKELLEIYKKEKGL